MPDTVGEPVGGFGVRNKLCAGYFGRSHSMQLIKDIPGFGRAWLDFYVVQRRRQSVEQESRTAESI
jgi:hypothetical protein